MAFNLCSSSAVHGMFVLPFFLPVGSGAEVVVAGLFPASPPPPVVVEGAVMAVVEPDWGDARRLRGFEGDTCAGGIGAPSGGAGPEKVGACCCCCCCPRDWDGELVETDVLIRLEVGGDLVDTKAVSQRMAVLEPAECQSV